MRHADTRPSCLLSGLTEQSELRELLDLLYGDLESSSTDERANGI